MIAQVREKFPDIPLMVAANGAYSLADLLHLQLLDRFHLIMIEQPLGWDDIVDHATLQRELETPICLDESIAGPDGRGRRSRLGPAGLSTSNSGGWVASWLPVRSVKCARQKRCRCGAGA